MIELIIVACLTSGECRDFPLLYDAREVSLITCSLAGQAEVAKWQSRHPDWRVARWGCGIAGERERSA
jgi:hypothetical protein